MFFPVAGPYAPEIKIAFPLLTSNFMHFHVLLSVCGLLLWLHASPDNERLEEEIRKRWIILVSALS
jgi:hypothetical protein